MVSNISFGNGYNVSPQQFDKIEKLVGYTIGSNSVDTEAGPFDGMGMMVGFTGVMESWKAGKWLYNNRKDGQITAGWNKGVDMAKADFAATKGMFANGGYKQASTYKTLWNNYSAKSVMDAIPEAEKLAKYDAAVVTKFERARKLAEYAKLNNSSKALKLADKALAEARFAAHGAIPATGFFSKIGSFFGKVTGASKISGVVKEYATKSPSVAKLLKFGKGNGAFLAIQGAMELFTQVIPTFTQLGTGKGMKQLGKSTVKTAANVGGWVAGSAIGGTIGSFICPGAGTLVGGAVGALCGMVGGFVGSWAAEKAVGTVVGKNELDIAKEEQKKQMTAQVAQDPQAMQQLIAAAEQKIQQEGTSTPDGKIAFGILSQLKAQQVQMPSAQNNYRMYQSQNAQTANASTQSFAGYNNKNIFGQQDYMDQDLMAMNSGLAQA